MPDGVFLSPSSEKNRFHLSLRRVPCHGKTAIGEVKSISWPLDVKRTPYSCDMKARSIVQKRSIPRTDVLSSHYRLLDYVKLKRFNRGYYDHGCFEDTMTDNSSGALIPRAVREVTFYGDMLLIALVGDVPYVAIRPIADFIGLDWSSQRHRIQRDEILHEESRLVVMTGADGKQREMFSLPLELLPGWHIARYTQQGASGI